MRAGVVTWFCLLSVAFNLPVLRAQTNLIKVATVARFDLLAEQNVGSLTNGYLTTGDGTVGRQTWLAAADQPRSFTVNFTISHFAWTPAAIHFVPASNGLVSLTIRGPWEQATNGLIYKQEVLWDALSATNGALPNGSFESVSAGVPASWWRTYGTDGAVNTGPTAPFQGLRYARVWHDGPFSCNISVTGGVPVTLTCYAQAFFPSNFSDIPRILSTSTPAHLAALKFMRGANLGNYLEAPPGQDWGAHYSAADFVNMRNQGFDHVRIPIGWNYYIGPGPNYTISNGFFGKVNFMVTNALNRGLGAIINIHNWNEFTTDALDYTNQFFSIWRQIGAYYSNYPPQLAFELINEPNGAGASTSILNPIYTEAIRQIRLSNPSRTIFVGPGQWNGISELNNLVLPVTDTNLIVTVHCYDPFLFTHQGATWPGPDTATTGLKFPGPPAMALTPAVGIGSWATNWIADYNSLPPEGNPSSPLAFNAKLQFARQWSDYYGRPLHVGEFGCYIMAETNSRARFYTEFRTIADSLGLGWAMWDWKAGFRYWDDTTSGPAPGMSQAMFPAPRLSSTAAGQLQLQAAKGKTLRIDRAASLSPPTWAPIQTQSMTAITWNFTDPAAAKTNSFFYRALWVK